MLSCFYLFIIIFSCYDHYLLTLYFNTFKLVLLLWFLRSKSLIWTCSLGLSWIQQGREGFFGKCLNLGFFFWFFVFFVFFWKIVNLSSPHKLSSLETATQWSPFCSSNFSHIDVRNSPLFDLLMIDSNQSHRPNFAFKHSHIFPTLPFLAQFRLDKIPSELKWLPFGNVSLVKPIMYVFLYFNNIFHFVQFFYPIRFSWPHC